MVRTSMLAALGLCLSAIIACNGAPSAVGRRDAMLLQVAKARTHGLAARSSGQLGRCDACADDFVDSGRCAALSVPVDIPFETLLTSPELEHCGECADEIRERCRGANHVSSGDDAELRCDACVEHFDSSEHCQALVAGVTSLEDMLQDSNFSDCMTCAEAILRNCAEYAQPRGDTTATDKTGNEPDCRRCAGDFQFAGLCGPLAGGAAPLEDILANSYLGECAPCAGTIRERCGVGGAAPEGEASTSAPGGETTTQSDQESTTQAAGAGMPENEGTTTQIGREEAADGEGASTSGEAADATTLGNEATTTRSDDKTEGVGEGEGGTTSSVGSSFSGGESTTTQAEGVGEGEDGTTSIVGSIFSGGESTTTQAEGVGEGEDGTTSSVGSSSSGGESTTTQAEGVGEGEGGTTSIVGSSFSGGESTTTQAEGVGEGEGGTTSNVGSSGSGGESTTTQAEGVGEGEGGTTSIVGSSSSGGESTTTQEEGVGEGEGGTTSNVGSSSSSGESTTTKPQAVANDLSCTFCASVFRREGGCGAMETNDAAFLAEMLKKPAFAGCAPSRCSTEFRTICTTGPAVAPYQTSCDWCAWAFDKAGGCEALNLSARFAGKRFEGDVGAVLAGLVMSHPELKPCSPRQCKEAFSAACPFADDAGLPDQKAELFDCEACLDDAETSGVCEHARLSNQTGSALSLPSVCVGIGQQCGVKLSELCFRSEGDGCDTAEEGDTCFGDVQWAMKEGLRSQRTWYRGLNEASTFEEFQSLFYTQHFHKCPKPCPVLNLPCHTSMPGDGCYEHVTWAMAEVGRGNKIYPSSLTTSSPFEEFQAWLHRIHHGDCPKPCGV